MKVGDIVIKSKGEYDAGKLGMIIKIITNSLGNTIVTVLGGDGTTSNWYDKKIEVINEDE